MEIIDAHVHVGDLASAMADARVFENSLGDDQDCRQRVERMRELEVAWAVIQPAHGYLKPEGIKDTMRVNDRVAAYRKRDPAHFPVALGTVEPMHGERSIPEIDRCKQELRLDGLSWHHRFHGCFIDNKWMRPILKRMSDFKLVPFVHTLPQDPLEASWRLQKLAFEFPELTFVALDAFSQYEGRLQAMHIAEHTPNILWDLSGMHNWQLIEGWAGEHPDKLVFSAEASYTSTTAHRRPALLDSILGSPSLPERARAMILGGNIRRVFPRGSAVSS